MVQHGETLRSVVAGNLARDADYVASLFADVDQLRLKALQLGEKAEKKSDLKTALLAVRELTRLVELQHRMHVEDRRDAAEVQRHPAWQRLQSALLSALREHPDAQASVIAAIASVLGAQGSPPGGMLGPPPSGGSAG